MGSEANPTDRPSGDGAAGTDRLRPDGAGGPAHSPNVADAFAGISRQLRELIEYVSYYLSARTDALWHLLLRMGLWAALGLAGVLAALAMLVTAAVLVCLGIAEGIDHLIHSRWIADLLTGLLVFGAIGGGGFAAFKFLSRSWFGRTRAKYAARQQEQRRRFGHDISQRAQNSR